MLDIAELILPIMVFTGPFAVGALKGYLTVNLARVLADIITPTVAALGVVYFLDMLLVSTQIIAESGTADIWYVLGLGVAAVLSWCGFYMAIGLGVLLAVKNDAGLQSDMEHGMELAERMVFPSLKRLLEESKKGMDELAKKRNAAVSDMIDVLDERIKDLEEQSQDTKESISVQQENIGAVYKHQQGLVPLLKSVKEYFETIPHLQDELVARIESLDEMQGDDPDTDGTLKTVLTPEDGRANRNMGHDKQDETARILRGMGFDVAVAHGPGQPDFVIKRKGTDTVVATGSCKAYTLHDEPKRMQRRVSRKDCIPEIKLAARLDVPMALLVTNRINGRKWIKIVESDELRGWEGVTTPVILAKNDEDSEIELEEIFADGVVNLGGVA